MPSEVLNANDVLGPEPAIATLPNHIRGQAPSILFRQDELPPEDVIVIVISNLGQHHRSLSSLLNYLLREEEKIRLGPGVRPVDSCAEQRLHNPGPIKPLALSALGNLHHNAAFAAAQ